MTKFDNKLFGCNQMFSPGDFTAGAETELQAGVKGKWDNIDLVNKILSSTFYKNLSRRYETGEIDFNRIKQLDNLIKNTNKHFWENSWVLLDENVLSDYAKDQIKKDFLENKSDVNSELRDDYADCYVNFKGVEKLRLPVSYLLNLALIDVVSNLSDLPEAIFEEAKKISSKYINDNTSPETLSFYISDDDDNLGENIANETSIRFLMTQFLCYYSNEKFELSKSGQEVVIFKSPLTPTFQKDLNSLVSDTFYRELFISPCLSGWNEGRKKKEYMIKCHKVLSRSRLNILSSLKDAGIIRNNLIILPDTSNTALSNNGIHLSIGSKLLTESFKAHFNFSMEKTEKYYIDLAIKIMEHFLPFFIGIYSASPYRAPYKDFHPEKILGFLPHELDYTHLRMLWRRWKKKGIRKTIFFNRIQPKGPYFVDLILEKLFFQRGDFIPDYRLIDYFVALLSTENESGFNGNLENQKKLKLALEEMGIFDSDMSFYAPIKGRYFKEVGFCGFELRIFSNFYSLKHDLKYAANLFALITSLAFKYIREDNITHASIPDERAVESERRQLLFASAIGIPTVYIKENTPNKFLLSILKHCKEIRKSNRYKGYIRVKLEDYRFALLKKIEADFKDNYINTYFEETLKDLYLRLINPEKQGVNKIIKEVLKKNKKTNPVDIVAEKFNKDMEIFYREELRIRHIKEGFLSLTEEILKIDFSNKEIRTLFNQVFKDTVVIKKIVDIREKFEKSGLTLKEIKFVIKAILLVSYIKNNEENLCKSTATSKEKITV
ncbi:MAG: hypothetical protein PWQ25_1191 [Deferribacteres bacterium]|nr:hypothetical protein [Deferribacteres bacterium]